MYIFIKGQRISNHKKRIYKDFARWTARKFLDIRTYKKISLTIQFIHPKNKKWEKEMYAQCIPEDDYDHERKYFTIQIRNEFEIMQSLIILSHEMVHLKQFAKGELTVCNKTGYDIWKKTKRINDTKKHYYDLPWEIEAHGREKGLVYQWAEIRGYDQSSDWYRKIF